VPLRIAFDLDGVLADMDGALLRHCEALFGEVVGQHLAAPTADAPAGPAGGGEQTGEASEPGSGAQDGAIPQVTSKLRITSRQGRRLWRHIGTVENFWESLDELEPGGIGRLAALAADRRWEVIFLTRRPRSAGHTSQVQTQRWLEMKGFALPSVYVVQGNRGRIAAALDLDFVVDDRPENCLDVVVDSKARAILVWRDDESHLPAAAKRLGIGVVRSVDECLDILAQIDSERPAEKPHVLARVRRLLGLKDAVKT
jgi:hypothetical protein